MEHEALLHPSQRQATVIAGICFALMAIAMIYLGWIPHLALMLAIGLLLLWGRARGLRFEQMQQGMAQGVMSGIGAIYLFFFIGILVAALMLSGAIPTLIDEGFAYLSPRYFYASAFVLTSVLGMAIGSSLTTCATLGVAFMAVASAFSLDPAITAGAVVSGAFFGDKMSPLSDTTSIAASVAGLDLFDHIKNMLYTTVPAWILSALIFLFLSGNPSASLEEIQQLRAQLQASGLIHHDALWTFAVLIVMALLRCNALFTIMTTVAVALIFAARHHQLDLSALGGYFFTGYRPEADLGAVGKMIARGGVNSMFFTQTIVILALSLGGLLQTLGVIPALLAAMERFLKQRHQLDYVAAGTALGTNILIGEQYLSLLLAGNAFKGEYQKLGLNPGHLARTLEDAGTVINPLVPWSVCGVFLADMLQVPVLSYLPYAFFCYFCLLITLIYAHTGWTHHKK